MSSRYPKNLAKTHICFDRRAGENLKHIYFFCVPRSQLPQEIKDLDFNPEPMGEGEYGTVLTGRLVTGVRIALKLVLLNSTIPNWNSWDTNTVDQASLQTIKEFEEEVANTIKYSKMEVSPQVFAHGQVDVKLVHPPTGVSQPLSGFSKCGFIVTKLYDTTLRNYVRSNLQRVQNELSILKVKFVALMLKMFDSEQMIQIDSHWGNVVVNVNNLEMRFIDIQAGRPLGMRGTTIASTRGMRNAMIEHVSWEFDLYCQQAMNPDNCYNEYRP